MANFDSQLTIQWAQRGRLDSIARTASSLESVPKLAATGIGFLT